MNRVLKEIRIAFCDVNIDNCVIFCIPHMPTLQGRVQSPHRCLIYNSEGNALQVNTWEIPGL